MKPHQFFQKIRNTSIFDVREHVLCTLQCLHNSSYFLQQIDSVCLFSDASEHEIFTAPQQLLQAFCSWLNVEGLCGFFSCLGKKYSHIAKPISSSPFFFIAVPAQEIFFCCCSAVDIFYLLKLNTRGSFLVHFPVVSILLSVQLFQQSRSYFALK